jgi:outer membrane receptor protein involved in Fe transport
MRYAYCASVALTSVLMLSTSSACAQSTEEDELALVYGDKSTISIATGSQQLLRRAPSVATVITAADIAAIGASDLDEVLETVPGLHVARSAITLASLYVVRGVFSQNNPQILMLQNGVPMTTMFQGNKGGVWGGLPVENIARIEIIRGPGSALYGADAYSGVINIITKNAGDVQGTLVGLRAGSFNTRDGWIQHGGKFGDVDVAAYLRIGRTDGYRGMISADAQSRNDRFFGTQATLAPGSVNTGHDAVDANVDADYDKWRIRANYKLRDNVGSGAGIASALDPVGKARSERITADLSWADPHFTQNWGLGFLGSYLHYADTVATNFILFPAGVKFPTGVFPDGMIGAPEKWERQFRVSAFATYSGFTGHQLRFGVGHDDLNLYRTEESKNFTFTPGGVPVPIGQIKDFTDTAPFMFPQRRKVHYVYAQDEWSLARDWTVTAGLRHDDYSDFGGTTNPRLAVVWDASLDVTAKLLYGRAFRAPSFAEEYSINNPVQRGNPNLRPETIKTMEAAITWQVRKDTQVNLNIFKYAMTDIIRAVANAIPGTGATFQNTGNQNGKGMEMELVWDADRNLRMTGNYSYQQSIDEATSLDAGYAPHSHLYIRGDWRFSSRWVFSSQANWVADRKRAPGDVRPPVPDYKTLDLTLRTNNGNGYWDIAASIRNVFNADVHEPSLAPGLIPNDLPMAPRAFWLQATYRM